MLAKELVSEVCPAACSDTTTTGLIIRGVSAAVAGDIISARQALQEVQAHSDRKRFAADILALEGWIASRENDWQTVIRTLKPARTRGQQPRVVGRLPVRWLVAEAYERLGDPEEAAVAYELVVSPSRLSVWSSLELEYQYVIFYSFAHHRLVLLYSKMGRVEDARRHWEIFAKTFTNPDPELVPMVEEARRALEEAEAKVSS